uniref:Uncharacterized protein n=1 Tax=Arundo donax TaxID=35708 RepID=A0A0A9A3F9_ARUDO
MDFNNWLSYPLALACRLLLPTHVLLHACTS